MSYIIGIDISEENNDFSVAIIAKVENGIVKIIDSKTSKDRKEITAFVKKHEPEYFNFKYKFNKLKEHQIAELKKLADEGKLLFPRKNTEYLMDELKRF